MAGTHADMDNDQHIKYGMKPKDKKGNLISKPAPGERVEFVSADPSIAKIVPVTFADGSVDPFNVWIESESVGGPVTLTANWYKSDGTLFKSESDTVTVKDAAPDALNTSFGGPPEPEP